jgi:hypothetical protein
VLVGLDGGNARALANARGILDSLQAAREEVDALEVRMGRTMPSGLRVGWPVTPRRVSPRAPHRVGLRRPPDQPFGTSTSGHSSKASQPQSRLSSSMRSIT